MSGLNNKACPKHIRKKIEDTYRKEKVPMTYDIHTKSIKYIELEKGGTVGNWWEKIPKPKF